MKFVYGFHQTIDTTNRNFFQCTGRSQYCVFIQCSYSFVRNYYGMYSSTKGSSCNTTNISDISNPIKYQKQGNFSTFCDKRNCILQILVLNFCYLCYDTFMI